MLIGSVFRICAFALNAGLVFLLIPEEPQLPWHDREPTSVWSEARSKIIRGLRQVEMDLERARQTPELPENVQAAERGQLKGGTSVPELGVCTLERGQGSVYSKC